MKPWVAAIPLAVLVLAAGMFAVKSLHRDSHVEPVAMVGKAVPKIALVPLEGGAPMDLPSAIQGPALVNVFASWCVPCAIEHPHLMALQKKGVRIIGVAYKDKVPDTANFLAKRGDPYDLVLTDPDRIAGVEFGIGAVPETFLIDSSGKILSKYLPISSDAQAAKVYADVQAAR